MSAALINKVDILKDRAEMFAQVRQFFSERNVIEVDVPILSQAASVDENIDLIEAKVLGKTAFLHSSPEYGMKRLLAEGMGDIYQLSHVFRDGERGNLHHVEFSMVEWYRLGFSLEDLIGETLDFCRLFFVFEEAQRADYKELFLNSVGYFPASMEKRDFLFAFEIEPHLGKGKPTIVTGFPKEQAALSQVDERGVAKRFEIYYEATEVANGYLELLDGGEQRRRLEEANVLRGQKGKSLYPLDEHFLSAIERGIPACAGVACGFDRLMMLRHKVKELHAILPLVD